MAAEKRERMHARLIESAIHVFTEKGMDGAIIEDVIARANVSRGTFYNYFKTNEELLIAALELLGNELLAIVDAAVQQRNDPIERLAYGVRTVLHTSLRNRVLARFVSRVGLGPSLANSLAVQYLQRDIQAGIKAGQFAVTSEELAMVLVLGATHAAIHAMATHPSLPENFPELVTHHVLLSLGVPSQHAAAMVSPPITSIEFPDDSLLSRTTTAS